MGHISLMLVHLECEQVLTCINIKVLDDACTPGVWTALFLYQHQSTGWCLYTWSVNRSLPVSTSKYCMMDDACTPGVWTGPYLYQHQRSGWCLYTWNVHRPLPVSTSKYWMMLVHLECEQTLSCINIKALDDACTPGVWTGPYLYEHQSTVWCLYTWSVNRSLPVSTSKKWMMLVHLKCTQTLTCINIKVLDDACTPGVWTDPLLYQHQSTGWCMYTWSVNRSLPVWTSKYCMMLKVYQCQSTRWFLYTWSVNRPLPVSKSKYCMMLVHLEFLPFRVVQLKRPGIPLKNQTLVVMVTRLCHPMTSWRCIGKDVAVWVVFKSGTGHFFHQDDNLNSPIL